MSLAALLLPFALAASAAPAPQKKVFPGLLIELKAEDGWTLKAKHLPAREDKLTFLLLHGTGQRKEDWYSLARLLASWGYGYLAVDFRGHGESQVGPDGQKKNWKQFKITKMENEFGNMTRDVAAGVAYLTGQGVPEEKIGVIGADVGSSIGLKYAAVHPKVPLAVLLSPRLSYQEVTAVNAMRAYKNRPLLMVYSDADKQSASAMPVLQGTAKLATGEKNTTVMVLAHEHGTKMLRRHRDLGPRIIAWIKEPVKPDLPELSTAAESVDGETAVSEIEEPVPAEGPYPVDEAGELPR